MRKTTAIKKIRLAMGGYSIAEFAELLGIKCKATYQGYDSGSRKTPPDVLQTAQEAQTRERLWFKNLPKRVDEAQGSAPVPNEAKPWSGHLLTLPRKGDEKCRD